MQRSLSNNILRIHIRTFCDKQFSNLRLTKTSRPKQRSLSPGFCIHIRSSSDVLFNGFDVSFPGSIVN